MSAGAATVFAAVVLGRLLLPLLILRYPLPALIGCLVLDGVDQTIFQLFGYDPPGYQSYDKAMDVFYLAIAYLATMRNWSSLDAFRVSRLLYFYRLIGVVLFELTHARALLLLFPNTFEYFFIAYEAIRTRWSPRRLALTTWLVIAAVIWVVVKLPQEYWLHVAQLDVTDTLAEYAWAPPLLIGLLALLAAVLWWVVRPRLPRPQWPVRLVADPLPEEMDTAEEQYAWHAEWGSLRTWATVEKIVLVGLLAVVFSETLPGVRATQLQVFLGVGIVVLVNAVFTLVQSRRARTFFSLGSAFVVRLLANIVLVLVADFVLRREGGDIDALDTLFFLSLISLITTIHDRYRPILAVRVVADREGRSDQ